MPHRSRVFKTRVLCKNNFTYSGVFKPYSDILKPYSGVFLQNFFISTRFREPYSDVFKPYSDVLKPYCSVFLQIFFPKCDHTICIVSCVKSSESYRRIVNVHESYDAVCVSCESYRIVKSYISYDT